MKRIGNISEAAVQAKLVGLEYPVLTPFGDTEPYDLVVQVDDVFVKVQVKTAREHDGSIKADHRRTNMTSGGNKQTKYTFDEIDVYILYWPEEDKAYWLPFKEAGETQTWLRVDEENAQYANKETKWAEDYELSVVL